MNFLPLSWRTKFVFISTGVFIGLLISVQFYSSVPNSSYISDQLSAQKELVKSFIDDQNLLKSKIIALHKKINEYQEKAKDGIENNNLENLRALKKEIGLEMAKGSGLELFLNDGFWVNRDADTNSEQFLIHASDLRDVVNLLRAAKVEALAINDQRVIASSPITSVGNTILVNNFHMLPPFNVTAIGDPELILQLLQDGAAIPDLQKRVKEGKVQMNMKTKSNAVVPAYNGNLSLQYITQISNTTAL